MAKRQCDFCGMREDHYGKNTMPVYRVPQGRHGSLLACDECIENEVKHLANNSDDVPDLSHLPKKYADSYSRHRQAQDFDQWEAGH